MASVFGTTHRVPIRRTPSRIRTSHVTLILLAGTAAAALCWVQLSVHGRLPSLAAAPGQHRLLEPDVDGNGITGGRVDDLLLQETVRHCMQQQDTFIALSRARAAGAAGPPSVAVWRPRDAGRGRGRKQSSSSSSSSGREPACPLLHIPLAAADRSIGLCTDAALYLQLLGGWIAPAAAGGGADADAADADADDAGGAGLASAQRCGARAAVLFLEPLYEAWLGWLGGSGGGRRVVAAYAPNFEHVFGYDGAAHARMRLVLCKVRRCEELMRPYLGGLGSRATLVYTGHTSLDPRALHAQQQPQRQQEAAAPGGGPPHLAAAARPLLALHVRGKSGLKHTKQLLDCWLQHPAWPRLTVLGPVPNEQVSVSDARAVRAAGNIAVPQPGRPQGPGWPAFDPVSAGQLSALLLSHALHIMPSEREGFGHSINEGRAAGAVLLVPDHPPMNELVRDGSGVLLRPRLAFSHDDPPVPALGKYGNISVSMAVEDICAGAAAAVALPQQRLVDMGRKARALFEADRADFEDRMRDVRELLASMLQAAAAEAVEGL